MSAAADLDRTRVNQRDASDPRSSAWVIANAGSGKTHVLTQRVIRLLLSGVDPAAILCLTFTKVAAAEMSRRVFQTLGAWAMLNEDGLAKEIAGLEDRPATANEMRQARQLFAKALETPGGLKIQTIHAFCERLLHEFPFEANVPGQFSVLDESAAAAALAKARAQVMNLAAAEPGSPLGRAVRHLAEEASDMQIGQALDALIAERDALRRWMERAAFKSGTGGIDDALADLKLRLGLGPDENEKTICTAICASASWDRASCTEIATAMLAASAEAGSILHSAATASDVLDEAAGRLAFFLARDNKVGWKSRSASHRIGAATCRARPSLSLDFDSESARLLSLARKLDLVRAYDATAALLTVGDGILAAYYLAKKQAGALDFTDLISKTRNLLSRSDAAQWVLYKLDRRVEHILVDEAQDTSPDQWKVVRAIAEDFFSGAGAASAPRTIFAVGDDKQSIFSFQGAAPEQLVEMQRFFAEKIDAAEMSFVVKPLFLSFRSTREVLEAVDKVFTGDLAGKITASSYEAHAWHRLHEPGHVVLLPRIVRQKADDPDDWTAPYTAPSAAETELADRVAGEVAAIRNTVLPTGKRLRDGEILILVRRRDAFAAAMNRALRNRQIPTAGADRIAVSTHIAILDLLALADVMLLPEDDLQLAALMKSPLLGLTEEELMRLAVGRGGRGLWSVLLDATDAPFAGIATKLRDWRGMADKITPFRFFATVLGPDGGRQRFRARLGGEADDVLDTFLSQALAYEATEAPSLQGFVRFIRANESDIKREAGEGASGVRIMTVHGAKGLEADVVFLVDTGGLIVVSGQRDTLVQIGEDRDDPAFLWRRLQAEAPDKQRRADEKAAVETTREYYRLLYVAMTRARDVLYVAGIRGKMTPPECWYSVVEKALVPDDPEKVGRDEFGEVAKPFQWPEAQRPPLEAKAEAVSPVGADALPPDWLHRSAPSPVLPPQPLRPSVGLGEPDPLPAIPASTVQIALGDDALLRGRLVHLLLQFLPPLPPGDRIKAAERLIAGEVEDELGSALVAEAARVLAHPQLKGLFSGEARAEAAIVGNVETGRGTYSVSGQIDRLVRDLAGWRLVDFKTDRAVPASVAEVAPGYVLQMALYRKLLMEMEPGTPVEATLVFTARPKIMPIPVETMERALAELGNRANPVP